MIHSVYIQNIKKKKREIKIATLYFRLSGRWTEINKKQLIFDLSKKVKSEIKKKQRQILYFDGQTESLKLLFLKKISANEF